MLYVNSFQGKMKMHNIKLMFLLVVTLPLMLNCRVHTYIHPKDINQSLKEQEAKQKQKQEYCKTYPDECP